MNLSDQLAAILRSYEPHDGLPEFGDGFVAYQHGNYENPYLGDTVKAQTWHRGFEAGSRYARLIEAKPRLGDWAREQERRRRSLGQ
jgi:hypothetical protein